MSNSAIQTLKACPLFSAINSDALSKLAEISSVCGFNKGELIFQQGEVCRGIYIVAEGSVKVFKLSPAGKEHLLHLASPHHTFAEVAVIGNFPCPAHAEAIENCSCVLIDANKFRQLLTQDHLLCMQILSGMAQWVRQLIGLMEDLVLRDAAGRLARHLLKARKADDHSLIDLPMLKKDLANHLNLTSETLSRTLKRLVETQLIESNDNQQIRVVDSTGLQAVADGHSPTF